MTLVRAAAVLALALAATSLAGCSSSSAGRPVGCSPARPFASTDVVRAGSTLTVSVSAVTCRPRFDDGGRLALTWVDAAGHRTHLATVHAHPSGAFEQEVTIPGSSAPGGGQVFVTGVQAPCDDGGSCAAYETFATVVEPKPDFSGSGRANRVAADIADRLQAAIGDRPFFVAPVIVPDGLEVVLRTPVNDGDRAAVERAFATAQRAAPVADRTTAAAAHLHVRWITHGLASFEAITMRIAHDSAWQRRHHLELTEWAGDLATDSVRIHLRHYSDAAAVLLVRRYGTAVTVSTVDQEPATAA